MITLLSVILFGLVIAIIWIGHVLTKLTDQLPAAGTVRVSLEQSPALNSAVAELADTISAHLSSIDVEVARCSEGLLGTIPACLDQISIALNDEETGPRAADAWGLEIDGILCLWGETRRQAAQRILDEASAVKRRAQREEREEQAMESARPTARARLREFQLREQVCDECRPGYNAFVRPDWTTTDDPALENTVVPCRHVRDRVAELGSQKCEVRTIRLPVPPEALSLDEDPEAVEAAEAGWDTLRKHLQ